MLMTEEQAATMWCPATREPYVVNRDLSIGVAGCNVGANDERPRCIGSRCMWWRWKDVEFQNRDYTSGVGPDDKDIAWMEREGFAPIDKAKKYWRRPQPNRRGYCGAAGHTGA